jgi:SAM-dependent methyltransferase
MDAVVNSETTGMTDPDDNIRVIRGFSLFASVIRANSWLNRRGVFCLVVINTMSLLELLHGGYVHKRRISVLSEFCSSLIPRNGRVLDVGSGDGRLARLVADKRPDISIQGIDVRLRSDAAIPIETFDGNTIPYGKGSFDVVMFIDVLHHTNDPMILLHEAARVARQAILIKDHLLEGAFAYSTLRFMDWVGNVRHGVALPYNYWTPAEWNGAFDRLGLSVSCWQSNLKLYGFPADLIFGRSLHFIAVLRVLGRRGNSDTGSRQLDR